LRRIKQRAGSADHLDRDNVELQDFRQKRWFESESVASINLASSLKLFHEDERPITKAHSRLKIFEGGFLGRRASMMKMTFTRRNTVA
jgi:hypothetical protein